jgi:arylsulfatase A-like enzyme
MVHFQLFLIMKIVKGILILFFTSFFSPLVARSPNLVVILTDDQGWGDLSLNGNKNLSTPNIDQLARDGASFDKFYVCPVCSPTRAEFLTGRYHARGGVYSTSAGGERLDLDEVTIGDAFKAAGYATGAFGKWHNGMQFPYHPNARGFDEFYGFCSGHWGNYFDPLLERNNQMVKGKGFCIDDFTNEAMQFIEASVKKEKPFFAYLPYNTPHSPMQVPDRWWKKFKDKELSMHHRDGSSKEKPLHLLCALAMCENIDWNVGRLLKKLDQLGVAEDTIVAYFCDNGPNGVRWNGDMRGRKGSTDEGGVRSPLLIRWPDRIKKGLHVEELSSAIDLLPTFAALCGIKVIGSKPLDGLDISPRLLGKSMPELKNRIVFSGWKGRTSVRTDTHRLDNKGNLYDMVKDFGQRRNIAKQQPDLAARLRKAVQKWHAEMQAELGKDERAFVIGHPDSVLTQVPARDGVASGNIQRSNKFPNCSFFRNWKNVDDAVTWQAEIGTSGKYAVEMWYACEADAVGTEVELSFKDRSIRATLTQANPMPLQGAEHDRFPRVESYVKDFTPMKLGVLDLKKGTGELKLRATRIPGKEAMEFRLLMFRRL